MAAFPMAPFDRDEAQFRQAYYGNLVRLLVREPDAALLAELARDMDVRIAAAEAVHPLLGDGWRVLRDALPGLDADTAGDEFIRLFIGPQAPKVYPYESSYVAGGVMREPLVQVREFMRQAGLERREADYPEPEDALPFELEVMNWLITRQLEEPRPERIEAWQQLQQKFLHQHLLVWAPTCAQDIENSPEAVFYKGVAMVLRGFLEGERDMLLALGLPPVATLEAARQRFRRRSVYKGPMFDPQPEATTQPLEPPESEEK